MAAKDQQQSVIHRHATFHGVAPFAQETSRPGKSPQAAEVDPGYPSVNVLVVEDNAINQIVVKEFLGSLGLQVILASDGDEALALCKKEMPDLVLMDIQMPGMDGLEATRRIRRLQNEGLLLRFPILALSAFDQDSDRVASLAAGADEHLVKPMDFMLLRSALQRWLPQFQPLQSRS